MTNKNICPLCGSANDCRYQEGQTKASFSCWCQNQTITFSEEKLAQLQGDAEAMACLCFACSKAVQEPS